MSNCFGNIVSQAGSLANEYRYKSKEYLQQSGLVYFGARYYDVGIGRFITPDPLGMVDGPNGYLYCSNDPLNYIDAYGLSGEGVGGWGIPGVGFPGGSGNGIDWGDIRGDTSDRQPGAAQINAGGCNGGSYFSNKGKEGKSKGGKQGQRDRNFGINNKKFWDWWHKIKQKYGYPDIASKADALYWYNQWQDGGYL